MYRRRNGEVRIAERFPAGFLLAPLGDVLAARRLGNVPMGANADGFQEVRQGLGQPLRGPDGIEVHTLCGSMRQPSENVSDIVGTIPAKLLPRDDPLSFFEEDRAAYGPLEIVFVRLEFPTGIKPIHQIKVALLSTATDNVR